MNKLMKILKSESVVAAAKMLGKALLTATLSALGVTWLSGCSALTPASKSQSMTVTALGFPAITVVTTTSQAATNSGDAEIADEALRKTYVSGQANIILGNFCGVLKSMTDSSRRDGNGRKIDSVCSIQPWMKGNRAQRRGYGELLVGDRDEVRWHRSG